MGATMSVHRTSGRPGRCLLPGSRGTGSQLAHESGKSTPASSRALPWG